MTEDSQRQLGDISLLGATIEGHLRRHIFANGRLQDLTIASILLEEWESIYRSFQGVLLRPGLERLVELLNRVELDFYGWEHLDSIATVELVCAIEEALGRDLPREALISMSSVNDLRVFLSQQGVPV